VCNSRREGGQRCATHTRPSYERTPPTSHDWPDAARDYASTPEGRERLTREAQEADDAGDHETAVMLRASVIRGNTLREANRETARLAATTTKPRTMSRDDVERVRQQFGVDRAQVLRDHAVSHVLGALARVVRADDLTFFGGTALSRTFLPVLRLSEDIDLIVRGDRADMARQIEQAVARDLARTHGTATWNPGLTQTRGPEDAVLRVGDNVQVRFQLLTKAGYPDWPTERRQLIQRYADAPDATLTTFTAPAFAANKTAVWLERRSPRDLYDLWALGQHGHVGPEATDLFRRLGPTGGRPAPWMFDKPPTEQAWQASLGHQGIVRVTAADALDQVAATWARALQADNQTD